MTEALVRQPTECTKNNNIVERSGSNNLATTDFRQRHIFASQLRGKVETVRNVNVLER